MSKPYKYSRLLSIIILAVILIVSIGSLAKLVSYFQYGADQNTALNLSEALSSEHTPQILWQNDSILYKEKINKYLRNKITENYTQAWQVTNISLLSKNLDGLEDYYCDSMLQYMEKIIPSNNLIIERIDLSHSITPNLLSIDQNYFSFTDGPVHIKEKITSKDGSLQMSEEYIDFYNIIMTREDGRWKIRKKVLEKRNKKIREPVNKVKLNNKVKGINYYPRKTPWKAFWVAYDRDVIRTDLSKIKEAGYDHIRIFFPFATLGKGHVDPTYLDNIEDLFAQAENFDISITATLFDFPIGFSLKHYTAYDNQMTTLINTLKNYKSLYAWDLKNEPDLDYRYHKKEEVDEWLKFIISRAKSLDDSHPITLGWSDIAYATKFAEELDFVSFHYYKEPEDLSPLLLKLQDELVNIPIAITEYGRSSYNPWWYPGYSEAEQKAYILDIENIINETNIPIHIAWCYSDYDVAPSDVFGWKPWIRAQQKKFGLIE